MGLPIILPFPFQGTCFKKSFLVDKKKISLLVLILQHSPLPNGLSFVKLLGASFQLNSYCSGHSKHSSNLSCQNSVNDFFHALAGCNISVSSIPLKAILFF